MVWWNEKQRKLRINEEEGNVICQHERAEKKGELKICFWNVAGLFKKCEET